jgi:hypothetical protein
MPQRVTLDAMIPREDLAIEDEGSFVLDLFPSLSVTNLAKDAAVLKLLRKPDFQRETNQWAPEQVATFIASFLDNEVIPSLILWKSPNFIFVIDGGHRLSALRAWMEDDYGDRTISRSFYNGEISASQKKIAERTRKLIEAKVGRFSSLKDLVGIRTANDVEKRRSNMLATRAIPVQWIQGSASVAETSFFKINSQGTPLDETEEFLIRNRLKPLSISARAILRAGAGHKYWSTFTDDIQIEIEALAKKFYQLVFEPEVEEPLKTLELSLGGSVSPVDALALLIEFLAITGFRNQINVDISEMPVDDDGTNTIKILNNSLEIVKHITGNWAGSLGLHPAVYFYNDRGKYNRFLFLGVSMLLTERISNNDKSFFKKFTTCRKHLEGFLVDNKSLIGIVLQNLSKKQRVPKMKMMLDFLLEEFTHESCPTVESVIHHLGLRGRIIDVVSAQMGNEFNDGTKSAIFLREALKVAIECPICHGKLDPRKSVSYDHVIPKREGGVASIDNGALVHPYCNTGFKS